MMRRVSSARISVVMCTFNGARFLDDQLQSLLSQTLQPYELIVCDDGSRDETVQLMEQFRLLAGFPVRIKVNETNLGSTGNFDKAMQLASGDYLALCDQDDVWFPEKLAVLACILDANPAVGGVFSDATMIDATGGPAGGAKTLWALHGFSGRMQTAFAAAPVPLLLRHDVVTGATLMVRASARSLWHPIPASWVHDGWMTWMLALHSRLAVVAEPLIGYRIHAQQQLGVGGLSRWERLSRMRNTERARFVRVADQFDDLRRQVEGNGAGGVELLRSLEGKVSHLRRRAALPRSLVSKIFVLLPHLSDYWKYARGWRSLRKDLLL